MNDVNWWLMALAFVLGLALTLAFMIRRVVREVPVYGAAGTSAAANLVGTKPKAAEADVDLPDAELPKASCVGHRCGRPRVRPELRGPRSSSVRAAVVLVTKSLTAQARCGAPRGRTCRPVARSRPTRIRCSITRRTVRRMSRRSPSCGSRRSLRPRRPASRAGTLMATPRRRSWSVAGAAMRAMPRRRSWSVAGAAMRAMPRRRSWSVAGAAMWAKNPTAQALCGWPRVRPTLLPATRSRATRIRCSITRPTARPTSRPIAEVWFRDAATAEAAGFNRWDSGKSQRGKKLRT